MIAYNAHCLHSVAYVVLLIVIGPSIQTYAAPSPLPVPHLPTVDVLAKALNATDAADPDSWVGYIYDGSDADTAPSWIGIFILYRLTCLLLL